MPRKKDDRAYLQDMLVYARKAVAILGERTFIEYSREEVIQFAVERLIEIIGESARCVSRERQESLPQIPWRPIVAQRHVIAHDYGEIAGERIYRVVTIHLPVLIAQLEQILAAEPPPTSESP
jgi:uncharacterized protein with HEPN domain